MLLQKHKHDWEDMGNLNPLWSILTSHRDWDVDAFFLTGEQEISAVMERATKMGYPRTRERVLDFGCGVGRLTRALTHYFPDCYGVDIADSMIDKARELNQSFTNCTFSVNAEPHLRMFEDEMFDMIYTNIVLQHIPDTQIILSYIEEFTRILKPGGLLVFQLPAYIPLPNRMQLRKRLYRVLRSIGLPEQYLYQKWNLYAMHMSYIPTEKVTSFLKERDMQLLEVIADTAAPPPTQSCTYYVTK